MLGVGLKYLLELPGVLLCELKVQAGSRSIAFDFLTTKADQKAIHVRSDVPFHAKIGVKAATLLVTGEGFEILGICKLRC